MRDRNSRAEQSIEPRNRLTRDGFFSVLLTALLCAGLYANGACSSPRSGGMANGANVSPDGAAGAGAAASGMDEFGNAGTGTATGTGGGAADSAMAGAAGTGGPPACIGDTQGAEPVGVDMFVMLDRSGSMLGETGAGGTKWDAIRSALVAFAQDTDSAGLGVGLQYFPLGVEGVPTTCMDDAECEATGGGACMNRACLPPLIGTPDFTACVSEDDCSALSGGCEPFGVCSGDDTLACFDLGEGGCDTDGDCVPIVGECSGFATCMPAEYATPAVPIAELPGNAQPFVDSLMNATTAGLTPTAPAIDGAVERAAAHAIANPTRRSIVVLATDGLPTVCADPSVLTVGEAVQEVADIAARGVGGTPSVRTYVIGVFSPEETIALESLEVMAQGGGTDHPFIVDTTADVAMQLLDALAEIRAGTLRCELQVPAPPEGQTLSYDLVNIELTSGNDIRTLLYVTNPAGCAGVELGWHYDVDPATGATPTTIQICENSCSEVQAQGSDATLEVRLGCATMGPE